MHTSFIENALALEYANWQYFFMTQVKNGATFSSSDLLILDGVAVSKSWVKQRIVGYEIKVSRWDFLQDKKRPYYMQYVNDFYFICPADMIKKEEMAENVWLKYVYEDGSIKTIKKAKFMNNPPCVDMLWYIIMSKLTSEVWRRGYRGDIEKFIEEKWSARDLGRRFSSKLINKLQKLEQEIIIKEESLKEYDETLLKLDNYFKQLQTDWHIGFFSTSGNSWRLGWQYIEAVESMRKNMKWDGLSELELTNLWKYISRVGEAHELLKTMHEKLSKKDL